jgi:hypothetical protein
VVAGLGMGVDDCCSRPDSILVGAVAVVTVVTTAAAPLAEVAADTADGTGLLVAVVRWRCVGSDKDFVVAVFVVPLVSPATVAAWACWRSSTACGVAVECP